MPSLDECKKPDGSTDWEKYRQLQEQETKERKAKGEICQRPDCNRFVMWSKGYPQTCSDCKNFDSDRELHHPSNIRCPKCGRGWSPWDGDDYEVASEGEHQVTCPDCDYEFEVSTSISYTFQSPARLKDGEKGEED